MTWDELAAQWKKFSGKLQAEWGRLTGDDVAPGRSRDPRRNPP